VTGVPKVFVNYRVEEQPGYASLLHRELAVRLGLDNVFLAARSIHPGDDFVNEVRDNLTQSAVLLALIGKHWLHFGSRTADVGRFEADHDWVHWEIAEAFARGVRVVPVLVDDAELPPVAALPPAIAALGRCQSVPLRHYSLDADIAQLVAMLERVVPGLVPEPPAAVAAGAESIYLRVTGPPLSQCRIGIVPGSIRSVRFADIWVNSENTDMLMARHTEFAISGIIRYWGAVRDDAGRVRHDLVADELRLKVDGSRPVAPGTAIVTGAGALRESHNVRHIIHVAAVHGEPGAGFRQVRDIGWCVANALTKAEQLAQGDPGVRTILFPLLGAGVAGAPTGITARAMLLAAIDYLRQHADTALEAIYLLAYSKHELAVLGSVWRALPLAAASAGSVVPVGRR
jgi:O-acetyl-ADP-ribose deacetylase (regulator of RNase III)